MKYTEIAQIPFNQALVEHFIPGFSGVFDILRRMGVKTMNDVMNFSKDKFVMAVGGTARRWQKVEESQQNLSTDEKVGLAIEQMAAFPPSFHRLS